ncbi:hypothetical protein FKM82_017583 [Ascaphus truei]
MCEEGPQLSGPGFSQIPLQAADDPELVRPYEAGRSFSAQTE